MDDSGQMKQLFIYERNASRIELLIRIVYSIAVGLVTIVYAIPVGICIIIQWFVILILGRRSEGLNNFIKGYLEYTVHELSYLNLTTDERPGIMPKSVEIYSKIKK